MSKNIIIVISKSPFMLQSKIFQKKGLEFPEKSLFEIVELKGQGHPDTVADTIAASVAIDYSNWWLKNGGCELETIPHYNFDKLLIAGGETEKKWSGGTIIRPAKIVLAGNATTSRGDLKIPLEQIAKQCVKRVLNGNIHRKFLPEIDNQISSSSEALSRSYLFKEFLSNDTSFGTSHYPHTPLEELVLKLDLELRGMKKRMAWLGSDIKVMGRRVKDQHHFTVATAFIDEYVCNISDYLEKKELVREELLALLPSNSILKLNQNDKEGEEGIENYYLTVTGSSAEHDDPGQVGRGNRVNGFIAPLRFQNVEAIAGKNLTRHVGGFFNFWANEIAKAIWNEFSIASQVILLCEIGQPIRSPYAFITLEERVSDSPLQRIIEEVIDNHGTIIEDILKGKKRDIYPFNYL